MGGQQARGSARQSRVSRAHARTRCVPSEAGATTDTRDVAFEMSGKMQEDELYIFAFM
jgi:hypothetical protein